MAEQDAGDGPRLHDRDPGPLLRAAQGGAAGARSGALRRLGHRDAPGWTLPPAPTSTSCTWDAKRDKVKINPLAIWTDEDVDVYAEVNAVLLNPLRQVGYTSIGCAPCTRATHPGEDPRAGRWAGNAKTECGLHT